MRLAVITPVGPGHERVAEECRASVDNAWLGAHGPFLQMRHFVIADHDGAMGRSRARNLGIEEAASFDWLLFLDADDLLLPRAFNLFGSGLRRNPECAAIFGAVHTDRHGTIPENVWPCGWPELMTHGARGTLSMGCFFRADVASATRFDDSLDAGEDFDFYLRALHGRPFWKLRSPLVTVRVTVNSATGPRGYVSLDWRAACERVIAPWREVA